MCEFKYCRGSGTCFLSKTSPCPGFDAANDKPKQKSRPTSRVRTAGLRYEGFLDHDELMGVLEMGDGPKAPTHNRLADVMSAAPRFFRRFQSSRSLGKEDAA